MMSMPLYTRGHWLYCSGTLIKCCSLQAKALEESNAAMLEQRQLLEVEVNQVRAAFKLLREENKQLSEANGTKDQTHNALMK